jgi:hypothetical protein
LLTRLRDGDEESNLALLVAKVNLLDESTTNPFSEEIITYTQPSATGQSVNKNYNLDLKVLDFQKLVHNEEKKINELKHDYDKVLAEINQFAREVVFQDISPEPRKNIHSAAQLHSAFNAQVKILEEEINNIGEDGLVQLEKQKVKAATKKKAVLRALRQLEEED